MHFIPAGNDGIALLGDDFPPILNALTKKPHAILGLNRSEIGNVTVKAEVLNIIQEICI